MKYIEDRIADLERAIGELANSMMEMNEQIGRLLGRERAGIVSKLGELDIKIKEAKRKRSHTRRPKRAKKHR